VWCGKRWLFSVRPAAMTRSVIFWEVYGLGDADQARLSRLAPFLPTTPPGCRSSSRDVWGGRPAPIKIQPPAPTWPDGGLTAHWGGETITLLSVTCSHVGPLFRSPLLGISLLYRHTKRENLNRAISYLQIHITCLLSLSVPGCRCLCSHRAASAAAAENTTFTPRETTLLWSVCLRRPAGGHVFTVGVFWVINRLDWFRCGLPGDVVCGHLLRTISKLYLRNYLSIWRVNFRWIFISGAGQTKQAFSCKKIDCMTHKNLTIVVFLLA